MPVGYSLSKEVSCSHSNFFKEEQGTWVKTWATFEWMKPLKYTLRCLGITSTAGVHEALLCAVYWGMEGFVLTENTGLCHHMAVLIPTEAASHSNFGGCALNVWPAHAFS